MQPQTLTPTATVSPIRRLAFIRHDGSRFHVEPIRAPRPRPLQEPTRHLELVLPSAS